VLVDGDYRRAWTGVSVFAESAEDIGENVILYVDIIILAAVVCTGLWAVMTRSILRAAIALALASALVAALMFKLGGALAAVFELSVCSGLISVLFISTISLAPPETSEEKAEHFKARFKRFKYLPGVIVLLAVGLSFLAVKMHTVPATKTIGCFGANSCSDARVILWSSRPMDMIGQVIILLAGVFGVVILFKETEKQ
jgi:NADH-quinone oxidoreductase subunit J